MRTWAGDPEVTKFLTWPTHESAEISRQILKEWVAAYDNPEVYQWCIEEKESGEPVGSIAVVSRNEKAQSCEIGYCISRSRWHKGITTEALAEVMRYLFEEVGVLRLESRHDPKNPYSGEVMKKCGMHYEGTRIRADCAFSLRLTTAILPTGSPLSFSSIHHWYTSGLS